MASELTPGEVIPRDGSITLNEGRDRRQMSVENTGDRPVQVGSHFHFFEVNAGLRFDRLRAYGYRLDIPAGTAVRFEPGCEKDVTLVAIGGRREVYGMAGLVEGELDDESIEQAAIQRARDRGYLPAQ